MTFCLFVCLSAYRSLVRFKRTQFFLYRIKCRNQSVPKIFHRLCTEHPNKVLFYYGNEKWTFEQIDHFSNRVANYFIDQGFQKGDEVALLMDNRPEYVGIWIGLAKAGVVVALVNTNQRLSTLIHSLSVINCKALIFGSELLQGMFDHFSNIS